MRCFLSGLACVLGLFALVAVSMLLAVSLPTPPLWGVMGLLGLLAVVTLAAGGYGIGSTFR